jgi:hypothetical protein
MTLTSLTRRRDITTAFWLFAVAEALSGCRTEPHRNAPSRTDGQAPVAIAAKGATSPEASRAIAAATTALLGRWRVVGYDGASVNPGGTPGTDPKQPTAYMAGASIDFTRDRFRLNRGSATVLDRPLTVIARRGPSEIGFDIGYGESRLELLGRVQARLHIATVPAHVVLIERVH